MDFISWLRPLHLRNAQLGNTQTRIHAQDHTRRPPTWNMNFISAMALSSCHTHSWGPAKKSRPCRESSPRVKEGGQGKRDDVMSRWLISVAYREVSGKHTTVTKQLQPESYYPILMGYSPFSLSMLRYWKVRAMGARPKPGPAARPASVKVMVTPAGKTVHEQKRFRGFEGQLPALDSACKVQQPGAQPGAAKQEASAGFPSQRSHPPNRKAPLFWEKPSSSTPAHTSVAQPRACMRMAYVAHGHGHSELCSIAFLQGS